MSEISVRKWPFVAVGVFVCAAGMLAGWFFGSLTDALMSLPLSPRGLATAGSIGGILGVIGGLLAGVLWSLLMFRLAGKGKRGGSIVGLGVLWGIVVGVLATVFLHAGLYFFTSEFGVPTFIFGLGFAVLSGAVTGLACVAIWWWAECGERRRLKTVQLHNPGSNA